VRWIVLAFVLVAALSPWAYALDVLGKVNPCAESLGRSDRFLSPLHGKSQAFGIGAEHGGDILSAQFCLVNSDGSVAASVPGLGGGRSPAAVAWSIIPIGVDPVDRHALGPRPHVRKESLEAIKPRLIDSNAPATVGVVIGVSRVVAALFHSAPSFVFDGSGSPVFPALPSSCFSLKATTTGCKSSLEAIERHRLIDPTITPAEPSGAWINEVNGNQSTEAMAANIEASHAP
jgi:hypothetical protein